MKIRDIIFWIHLCLGLSVGAVVLVMSVTGVILAFRPQILEFVERDVRKVPIAQGASQVSIDEMIIQLRASQSEIEIKSVTIKRDPAESIVVSSRKEGMIYLNPYTGEVLGKESKARDFLEQVEIWHRWIGMRGKLKPIGHQIKGAASIVFFFLVVSGFYLWFPRRWDWNSFQWILTFNPQSKGKARDWNWHNVIGFWGAPFLGIIVLTGIIMAYPWANNLLYRLTGNEPPAQISSEGNPSTMKASADRSPEEAVSRQPASLDIFFTRAREKSPRWVSMNIRLPQKAGTPVSVSIEDDSFWKPNRRSQLTLDYSTADVLKWEPYDEQNLGRTLRLWSRFLHTGEALGLQGQILACMAASGAVVLVGTGGAMAWRRFLGRSK